MVFAYISKSENFHVADEQSAKDYSINGKYVEYKGTNEGGYPTINVNGKEEQMVIYTDTMQGYINGNKKNGMQVSIPADIVEVINRLK